MSETFSRTRARLATTNAGPGALTTIVGLVLVTAWTAWFANAQVAIYATSHSARLEVDAANRQVAAPVGGVVVSAVRRAGDTVAKGDVLFELDVRREDYLLREERSRLDGLAPQVDRLRLEIAAQEARRREAAATADATRAETASRLNEANAAVDLAADRERRISALAESGLATAAEMTRDRSELQQRRAAAETLRLSLERTEAERREKDTELRVEIERLQRQVTALDAARVSSQATIDRLRHEGALRQITAPVDGTLAEVADIHPGAVLQEGQVVATVLPKGDLRVVAAFLPADVLGRVAEGQPARLRLDGFPFTQYGRVEAVVSTVAHEVRDGRVRVELKVTHAPATVPVQHGLPGTVEVEVEQVSPAALLLRAAGRRLSPTVQAAER